MSDVIWALLLNLPSLVISGVIVRALRFKKSPYTRAEIKRMKEECVSISSDIDSAVEKCQKYAEMEARLERQVLTGTLQCAKGTKVA